MTTNDIGGYRDYYRWPHGWSREIATHVSSATAQIDFLYDDLEKWTYGAHWSVFPDDKTPPERCVDFYWSTDTQERCQLPLDVGDDLVRLLLFYAEDELLVIIWNGRWWRPAEGWQDYHGEQGDFVDHVHTEWKVDA